MDVMICVIIPTYNSGESLGPLLKAVNAAALRCVVSDGGSADNTIKIAAASGANIALGSPGRGHQLRRAVGLAGDCEWLLFLHADSDLPENWYDVLQRHIRDHADKAGYFDLRFDSPRFSARIIEGLASLRCRFFGLPYGDQGLLVSKALYEAADGYPAAPLFEDVALIRRLGKFRIRRLGAPLLTRPDKFERDGYFRRGWGNFRLLRRYLKGETAVSLSKEYT